MSNMTFKTKALALLACVACALSANAYSFYVDSVYYYITGANTVEVTNKSYRTASYTGDVVIPPTVTYNDITYTVTAIGDDAFYGSSGMTSIQLPNTIKIINFCAFDNCSGFSEIVIPDSVTKIDDSAFNGCRKLARISLPEGLTYIGTYAFSNCSFTEITLPESLTTLGGGAFHWCIKLNSLYIPKNVKQIGVGVCAGCEYLSEITVDPENAFYDSREDCNAIIETATNKLIGGASTAFIPNTVTTDAKKYTHSNLL